jgi:hypothetical protein
MDDILINFLFVVFFHLFKIRLISILLLQHLALSHSYTSKSSTRPKTLIADQLHRFQAHISYFSTSIFTPY